MSRGLPRRGRAGGSLLVIAASCALLGGCVYRQFTVTTTPPGAIVQVNGKTVGPSPVDVPFIHYGTYRLTIFREGFQTLVVDQPVPAPWYEWCPFEFISEHLIPWTIQDKRRYNFDLMPLQVPSPEAVQIRAQTLREAGKGLGIPSGIMPVAVPVQRPPNESFETLPTPNPVPPPGTAAPVPVLPPLPPGAGN